MSRRNKSARSPRTILRIEQLEDRRMLAFSFSDFSDASDLNLVGDAFISADNRLRLTPAIGNRAGAAWYVTEKQPVLEGFSTSFQFHLANDASGAEGSDGFAFAVQNVDPSFIGGTGGELGYDGLPNSLVVEFDAHQNGEYSDPSVSHISVHTNGVDANSVHEDFSLGSFSTNPFIDDAEIHTVTIAYIPGSLSIFLDDPDTPVLTVDADLGSLLSLDDGAAWVGFTAGTGGDELSHDILTWDFSSDQPVTPLSVNDVAQAEGASGTSAFIFTVTRGGDVSGATTVDWTTDNGTATAPGDYVAASGQVSFAAGETELHVSVAVKGDAGIEGNETFFVRLSNAVGGGIIDSTGKGTILNDDANVSISDAAQVAEGNTASFTVTLSAAAGIPVVVDYTLANGTATDGEDFDGTPGTITFAPGQTQRTILIPTINDDLHEPGIENFFVNLTLDTAGPTIVDGQGRGTISSEDPKPTKFYVVNDAALNLAYKYAADNDAVGANSLAAANTAPRGVASNAAGDRLWVIDANRKVYVYRHGSLIGSWIASGLAASAQPQGIATDGTDIWIVDAKSDKVLRYAGAASRLSGSQNFAGSFNLVNQNSNPTDLVTDGTSLWVVNNLAVDKVFKYTVGGSLLGRWVIDPANSTPTGITIDPSDVGDMWIVDNASNRVFQYADAATRTSGSQLAFASFALAPGNTNPQGIADPPATGVAAVGPTSVQSSELAVAQQFTEAGKRTNKKAREMAFAQENFWRSEI